MKMYFLTMWSLSAALLVGAAEAQPVNQSNFRNYASCDEIQIEGRWFNTFGEGPCPPGSRRASSNRIADPSNVNSQTMKRTEASVAALGAMQQSVLRLGRSIGQAYQKASDKRAATFAYHLHNDPAGEAPGELYTSRKVTFPLNGTVVFAGLNDPILTESEGFFSECFIPLQGGEAKQIGGHRHTIQTGELTCKLKQKDAAFTPLYNNYSFSGGAMSMGQTVKLKGETYQLCYRNMGMNAMCIKDIPQDKMVQALGIVEMKETARPLAIFKGSVGEKVSLEEAGNVMTFDMSSSRSIEIGGVEFEVLEYNDNELVMRRK